jgi:hypothetical protein
MGGSEGVVFALGPLGEPGEPLGLAQGPDAVAASGQDLMGVGLVADVPDQAVPRRIEYIMKRDRQLDHAQARAQMTTGHRDGADGLGPQFVRHLPELVFRKPAQVHRCGNRVEQGGGQCISRWA